jgi:quinol monooxygenase YgiN
MAANHITTIDATKPVVTLINVYEVEPEKQTELVALLAAATEHVMRHQPGFLSVNIHRSVDGRRVANYAQWASKEDLERMMRSPEAQMQIKRFAAVARSASPAVYEVSSVYAA